MTPEARASIDYSKETPSELVKKIPFPTIINDLIKRCELSINDPNINEKLQALVKDPSYFKGWLAWQTVRNEGARESELPLEKTFSGYVLDSDKYSNPLPRTGFEGYFVGETTSDAIKEIAGLGIKIITSIKNRHPHKPNPLPKILRILFENETTRDGDYRLVSDLAIGFSATLATLRAKILRNQVYNNSAITYQSETKQGVMSILNSFVYQLNNQVLEEGYLLPKMERQNPESLIRPEEMNWLNLEDDNLKTGYLLMSQIGKLGHPLIRTAIRERNTDIGYSFF